MGKIVTDKVLLRKMAKKKHFEWPVVLMKGTPHEERHEEFFYVRNTGKPEFVFDDARYCIQYFDGSFFPYVVQQGVIK